MQAYIFAQKTKDTEHKNKFSKQRRQTKIWALLIEMRWTKANEMWNLENIKYSVQSRLRVKLGYYGKGEE